MLASASGLAAVALVLVLLDRDDDEAGRRATAEPEASRAVDGAALAEVRPIRAAAADPAPPSTGSTADERSARDFILAQDAGAEVLARLEQQGVDVDGLPVPPPFEAVREELFERFLGLEFEDAGFVADLVGFDAGRSTAEVCERLKLVLGGRSIPVEELEAHAAADNDAVRIAAQDLVAARRRARAEVLDGGQYLATPYTAAPEEFRRRCYPPGDEVFATKAAALDGWALSAAFTQGGHAEYHRSHLRLMELWEARRARLQAFIDAH